MSLRGEMGVFGGQKSPHECVVIVKRNNRTCVLCVHPIHVKLSTSFRRGCLNDDRVFNDFNIANWVGSKRNYTTLPYPSTQSPIKINPSDKYENSVMQPVTLPINTPPYSPHNIHHDLHSQTPVQVRIKDSTIEPNEPVECEDNGTAGPLCVLLDFPTHFSSHITRRFLTPAQVIGKTIKNGSSVAVLEKDSEGRWYPCEVHKVKKEMVRKTFNMSEDGKLPPEIEEEVQRVGGVEPSAEPTRCEIESEESDIGNYPPEDSHTVHSIINLNTDKQTPHALSAEVNYQMTAKGHITASKEDINKGLFNESMFKELNQFHKYGILEHINSIPKDTSVIPAVWLHTYKRVNSPDDKIQYKPKSRLIALGNKDKYITETYSGTPDLGLMKLCLLYALEYNWDIMITDVVTAFLQAGKQSDIIRYIKLPSLIPSEVTNKMPMFKPGFIYKLSGNMYGLDFAPRTYTNWFKSVVNKLGWYEIDESIFGFKRDNIIYNSINANVCR
eukprot:GHVR01102677.1.p1 GENE.GHVR01102677.1~~GHVR01102677.1.p1  ORF type:complete len:499 (+),score=74.58 GHVR01102677.1:991-2487(+)